VDIWRAVVSGILEPKLEILGAIGSCLSLSTTTTMIPFMPDGWAPSAGGFPAMTEHVAFLMKDFVLLAASFYLLRQQDDALRVASSSNAFTEEGALVKGGRSWSRHCPATMLRIANTREHPRIKRISWRPLVSRGFRRRSSGPKRLLTAIIIGSGPNGLSAAIVLAAAGIASTVFERNLQIGGARSTAETTLPNFLQDLGSSAYPMGIASPFFRSLPIDLP
jgi:NAD(P)-binding Rossmann-like domain/Protein of unknown function, DUF417